MSVAFYDENHAEFIRNTLGVEMLELYQPFCKLLPKSAKILDAGCGSGRDTLHFTQNGYRVVAIDASAKMVSATKRLTGVECHQMWFEHLNLVGDFDAIWACASILHVKRDNLCSVLKNLASVLVPSGVIYASFKNGSFERQVGLRYFNDMNIGSLGDVISKVDSLEVKEIWLTKDVRPGRSEEKWLNCILKKTDLNI